MIIDVKLGTEWILKKQFLSKILMKQSNIFLNIWIELIIREVLLDLVKIYSRHLKCTISQFLDLTDFNVVLVKVPCIFAGPWKAISGLILRGQYITQVYIT